MRFVVGVVLNSLAVSILSAYAPLWVVFVSCSIVVIATLIATSERF